MSSLHARRKFEQRIANDADQAEFSAMVRGSAVTDAGTYDDRVAGALDDFDAEDVTAGERWHRQDLAADSAAGRVQEEVERRRSLIGAAYPFELRGGEIMYRQGRTNVYEFCLAIRSARSITEGAYVQLPRVFERLCATIVKGFFGGFAECIHVGSPREPEVGKRFRAAMEGLHGRTGEWHWGPDPDLSDDPANEKDEGMDFVVWHPSLDRRPGQLFILGQCACGNDWDDKFTDLDLARLGKWFNPISFVPPVRAFTTPHLLSDGNLINANREAGLVFDRARLVLIAERLYDEAKLDGWPATLAPLATLVTAAAA